MADDSRRDFLKKTGISILGVGCASSVASAIAGSLDTETTPEGLRGKRWAMVVDTTKCDNCGKCVEACHRVHNVPKIESPRHEVKWIWFEGYEHAFPVHNKEHAHVPEHLLKRRVAVLCNHCERPPCVRVCPTQATFKRKDGVVMMDMHRCIGCRYCITACPYGSRSFNWMDPRPHIKSIDPVFPTRCKGVVEKCNFCAERLAKGQIPACVEICQQQCGGALAFGDLGDPGSQVSRILQATRSQRRKPELGTAPHVFYIV